MLRYPLIILRRSQRIYDNRSLPEHFRGLRPARAALLILGSKATEDRAVDIQNANNLIFNHQRQYDFRIAAGIAGDVAVKRMNIFDTLNLTGRHCGTAHAATYRDTHAGEFPWKGPSTSVSPSSR